MNKAAPLLGEHTEDVLTDFLGYTDNEISKLVEKGVLT
jgi:crotonobetainyl-CoA:carnitine CoA-transferase CaiB-like acyl-CoA transferase